MSLSTAGLLGGVGIGGCGSVTPAGTGTAGSSGGDSGGASGTAGTTGSAGTTGRASQCVNPSVTFKESEYVTLTFDGGKRLSVYLPMYMGNSLTLYIASDGSTFRDAALTVPARLHP